MNFIDLRYRIEKSWSKLTTYCPERWTEDNPSLCQCKISSVLVHKVLKNHKQYHCRLMNGMVCNSPHWWNEINGVPFDTTWSQFHAPNTIRDITECIDENVLEEKWEFDCYNELEKIFNQIQFSE